MIERTSEFPRTLAPAEPSAGPALARRMWAASTVIQAAVISVVVYFGVGGFGRDFHVPLDFSSDTLVFLAQGKSTADNGWWWVNSRLAAPSSFQALLLPSNSNVDQAIVWVVSRVASFPLSINLSWMLMLVLSGVSATFCLRTLGVSRVASLAIGTLFALSPYALYRQLGHFSLVIYLVPFPAALAIQLAAGRVTRWREALPLLAGCALLGFNYVYYAFFASFLLIVGGVAGFFIARDGRVPRRAALALGVVVTCVALNFAPSWYLEYREGVPLIVREKTPAEAEIYGLKIRQLVSPVYNHRFSLFHKWTERETAAGFPLETENRSSRLGVVASVGFMALLLAPLAWGGASRRRGSALLGTSQLTLAALLLCTIGGFGSLFNLMVLPDIRGYNRICPFLAFFALFAVAIGLDAIARRGRTVAAIAAAAVAALGVWDQAQALQGIATEGSRIKAEYSSLEAFVARLEAAAPNGAAALQLPFTVYLNDNGRGRMRAYDHFKPYLVSNHLRWSYPALSNAQFAWQEGAAQLQPAELAAFAAVEGFGLIVLDRYGYDDRGAAMIAALTAIPGAKPLVDDERYLAVDIRDVDRAAAMLTPDRLSEIRTDAPITPRLAACAGEPPFGLSKLGVATLPDLTVRIGLPAAARITVAGWAVTPVGSQAGADVEIAIDGKAYPVAYGLDRPDVAAYLRTPAAQPSGFVGVIPIVDLSPGAHALTVRVLAPDGRCFYESRQVAIAKP